MAETEPTQTDIFQQQKKTIDTLIDVLERQGAGPPQQMVFAAPAPKSEKKTPDYLKWIAIAAVMFFLLKGKL